MKNRKFYCGFGVGTKICFSLTYILSANCRYCQLGFSSKIKVLQLGLAWLGTFMAQLGSSRKIPARAHHYFLCIVQQLFKGGNCQLLGLFECNNYSREETMYSWKYLLARYSFTLYHIFALYIFWIYCVHCDTYLCRS